MASDSHTFQPSGLVLGCQLVVGLGVDIPLPVPRLEQIAGLRADPRHARLEIAERRTRTVVAVQLIVDIAHQADADAPRPEPRGASVEVGIDPPGPKALPAA